MERSLTGVILTGNLEVKESKKWNQRYLVLTHESLHFFNSDFSGWILTIPISEINACRNSTNRSFGFEVVSPTQTLQLTAENENERTR